MKQIQMIQNHYILSQTPKICRTPTPSTTPTITSKSVFLTPSCMLELAVPISCFLQISTQPHLWGAFFFYFMIYQLTPLHKTGCCSEVAPPLQNLHHMNSWKLPQSVALCIKHSVKQEVTSYWTLNEHTISYYFTNKLFYKRLCTIDRSERYFANLTHLQGS